MYLFALLKLPEYFVHFLKFIGSDGGPHLSLGLAPLLPVSPPPVVLVLLLFEGLGHFVVLLNSSVQVLVVVILVLIAVGRVDVLPGEGEGETLEVAVPAGFVELTGRAEFAGLERGVEEGLVLLEGRGVRRFGAHGCL